MIKKRKYTKKKNIKLRKKRKYIYKIKKKYTHKPKRKYNKRKHKIIEIVKLPVNTFPSKKLLPKMYFTQETENAIIAYNSEIDETKRNNIYNSKIKYAFEKLVENIFNTFKFPYSEVGPLDFQKETLSHLVANISKFDSSKGKAFSYFSIVAKNYLIAENKKNYTRFNRHSDIGEEKDESTIQLQSEDKYYKNQEIKEFINLMVKFWDNNVEKIFTKQKDLEIAQAIIELFRNNKRIEVFNKKALYLMIREISNCCTQNITKIITKMKSYQKSIFKSYINTGNVNIDRCIKS
jgi:hypothetical protein